MDDKSIFWFLTNKKQLKEIYLQCIAMEKEISMEIYSNAIVTGRTITEMIVKLIAKTDKVLSKKYFKTKNGKEPKPKLWQLIKECNNRGLINPKIREIIEDIQEMGNDSHHSFILSKYTLDNAKEIHKKVFLLCLDTYNNFFDYENIEYKFDLGYLKEDAAFTHEELMNHINNIQENTVYKYDLIKYIEEKEMFLPIASFKNIMVNYINNIIDVEEYEDSIDAINFIDYDIFERIIDNIDNNVSEKLLNDILELNVKNITDVKNELKSLNDDYIELNEIDSIIEENNQKRNVYELIKLIFVDYIIAKYNEIISGLKSIKVSKLDKNNRIIVESPYLKVMEENNKISIVEDDNKIILNDDQRDAVTYYDSDNKYLAIDAGPGSGKTRVIIERVVHLIKERGQHPSTILVITFTRKATEELRERFKKDTDLTINQINQMRISTIHSFCRHIISKFSDGPYNYLMRKGERGLFIQDNKENLDFIRDSFIYDNNVSDITEAYNDYFNFKVIYDKLESYISSKYTIKKSFYKFIDEFYEDKPDYIAPPWNLIKSSGFGRDWHFALHHAVAKSYEDYKGLLDERKVCDNNHLLEKANELLEDDSILNRIKYNNILIDEFQDTDHVQKELFDKLLSKNGLNTFTVVGDADQSIYGWRGAYPDLFKKYVDDEEGYNFKRITLHTNYRSSKDIVKFNEEFIKDHRQIPKELVSNKGSNLPVYYLPNTNSYEEATNIVSIIQTLKDNKKIDNYGDIAILFRSNNDVDRIIEPLENADIPYYLKEKNDFLDQSEVKAILTLLWYLMPYKKDQYVLRSEDFLNLHGFTNERYKSSHIFKLSEETMKILDNIQNNYDETFLRLGIKKIRSNLQYKYRNYKSNPITRANLYQEIFYSLNQKDLNDLFSQIDSRDLAEYDETQLRKLGITDNHDLNFFKNLNKLKFTIHNRDIKKYEKPTTMDVFFELLTIIDFYEDINIQKNKEAKKIKSNLALISEVIYDFESIVGKHRYERLFKYLNGVFSQYSCPIHDLEDNIDKVHIMTVHKAKGLEYPVVIVGSLNHEIKINDSEGKFETPFYCLEYKPNTADEEENNRLEEEYRILYVAMTRAEELLILSSVNRRQLPPKFLSEIAENFNRLRKIEPYAYNLASIPKIASSKKSEKTKIFPELSFENIINDYLFCPVYYDIYDNTKFKNRYNDDFFTDQRMHLALEKIFSNKGISNQEIEKIIQDIKDSFMIKKGDETSQILNMIPKFWNKYGKYYAPLENTEMGLTTAYIMNNCDLHGKIDLIVKEDDKNINIVKFVSSNYKISKFLDFYKYLLSFYPMMIKNHDSLKGYTIKNIILHFIKENEQYIIPFEENNEEEIVKILHGYVNKIINEDFDKHTNNCSRCPYKNTICKG